MSDQKMKNFNAGTQRQLKIKNEKLKIKNFNAGTQRQLKIKNEKLKINKKL